MKPTNTMSVSARLLTKDVHAIDGLVAQGFITSRADFIRQAVNEKVQKTKTEA